MFSDELRSIFAEYEEKEKKIDYNKILLELHDKWERRIEDYVDKAYLKIKEELRQKALSGDVTVMKGLFIKKRYIWTVYGWNHWCNDETLKIREDLLKNNIYRKALNSLTREQILKFWVYFDDTELMKRICERCIADGLKATCSKTKDKEFNYDCFAIRVELYLDT